ncbi:MAG: transglycosylase SLT domain-containing protein [Rhodocyclaceae bacterium]|nr:transglycosylase SLT domain-containing protein [Rhodocyclaceae bacterium]
MRARLRALLPLLVSGVLTLAPGFLHAEVAMRETGLQLTPQISAGMATPQLENAASRLSPAQLEDDLPRIAAIDLTTQAPDLWQRMRNGFSMPDLDSPLVADRQAWYLNRPETMKRLVQRSRRYLYYIVTELEKRGMPTELALLPMVESAFNPLARSPAKALGMWQFIPSTGKNYNLEQTWWLDKRRDIIASTGAALDYLQNIYDMHGDWHLALASYNWGENAVAKAVARNQAKGLPSDYPSLTMPNETRYYVPKLQALKNIIANPELFGITLDPLPNQPYFDTVDMPATMDVATAAKLAEIPLDEFIALNPAYSRPLMHDSPSSVLVLPADKISVFQNNLQRHEDADRPLALWHTEAMKRGEKLATFAARHGLPLARLKQINGIGRQTKLKPGFKLLVPSPSANAAQVLAQLPQMPPEAAPKAKNRGKRGRVAVKKKGSAPAAYSAATRSKPMKKSAAKVVRKKQR